MSKYNKTNEYNKNNYVGLSFRVKPDIKAKLCQIASDEGISLTKLVIKACYQYASGK
jgi:hypothetical protein